MLLEKPEESFQDPLLVVSRLLALDLLELLVRDVAGVVGHRLVGVDHGV